MRKTRTHLTRRAYQSGSAALRRVRLLEMHFDEELPLAVIANRWPEDSAHVQREYARARREFRSVLLETVRFYEPGSRAEVRSRCRDLLHAVG